MESLRDARRERAFEVPEAFRCRLIAIANTVAVGTKNPETSGFFLDKGPMNAYDRRQPRTCRCSGAGYAGPGAIRA
jgi:hypothetical protein